MTVSSGASAAAWSRSASILPSEALAAARSSASSTSPGTQSQHTSSYKAASLVG